MSRGRKCRELRGINILSASKIFPWRGRFRPHCYYHVAPLSPAVLDIKTIMETVGLRQTTGKRQIDSERRGMRVEGVKERKRRA